MIILCETWLNENIFTMELFDDRYIVYRCDRDKTLVNKADGGGCLIAIKAIYKSNRASEFELVNEDIWISIDHKDHVKVHWTNTSVISIKSVTLLLMVNRMSTLLYLVIIIYQILSVGII